MEFFFRRSVLIAFVSQTPERRIGNAWFFFGLWLVVCCAIFWKLFFVGLIDRPGTLLVPFPGGDAAQSNFEAWAARRLARPPGHAMLVHVVDSDCPCERLAIDIRRRLNQEASSQDVVIREIEATGDDESDERSDGHAFVERAVLREWISATPALIVVDQNGHAAYAGTPGAPQLCSTSDARTTPFGYVHSAFTTAATAPVASGCFCPI